MKLTEDLALAEQLRARREDLNRDLEATKAQLAEVEGRILTELQRRGKAVRFGEHVFLMHPCYPHDLYRIKLEEPDGQEET